jgi:tetratricopeptide (TPR) repeat protein
LTPRERADVSKVLNEALALHRAGQWAGAARLYQSILADTPDDPEVLNLLGVLHYQQGQHARAVELIGRAVALRPGVANFHANLAAAYRALGQLEQAADCCRTALRLQPNSPDALNNLGLALHGLGRREEAVEHFRASLRLRPDAPLVHGNLGLVLHELRRIDEALVHWGRAVELAPGLVSARSHLGRLLRERGRPAEALPHFQEALRLQPNAAELHCDLGDSLRDLERPVEAQAAYREAVRLAPSFARAHANLGLLLQQEGQLREAVPCLQRAADLEPQNIHFWVALGQMQGELEEAETAISCWQCALVLDPNRADAHLGLGEALQQQGRLTEAEECFRIALRLKPDLVEAQIALGNLHDEKGDLAEAEAAYRAALRMEPKHPLPLCRLVRLLGGRLPDADCAALEERLADPQMTPETRTMLLFGLVQVLDARGEYGRAAEAARQANAATLKNKHRRRDYDPIRHERFVDWVLRFFDRDFFARVAAGGLPTRRPVFVFGLPRSGTTLVEQVLASHPHVHGAGELTLSRQTFDAIPAGVRRTDLPWEDVVSHLDAAAIRRLAEWHLEKLAALDGGRAERIVDKMPANYQLIGLLAALFPQATFIHCRRDLRDIAVSCWLTDFGNVQWANDVEGIAARFRQYLRLMRHWRKVLPVPVHEAAYEETVADLEGTARRLIAACGLDWHPACLEFHRTRRVVRTASLVQVRQPVYTKSVARWKHYEGLLDDLFAALPREEEPA